MRVLDYRRLGKQRLEARLLLETLRGERRGWARHPATLMWQGYENALTAYMNAAIREWVRRGYRNSLPIVKLRGPVVMPPWLGKRAFHASHRSNLLRKDPAWYGQFGWKESPDLPYVWPVAKAGAVGRAARPPNSNSNSGVLGPSGVTY